MPQLDAHIPAGALTEQAERDLIAKLTDILIEHEGADPTNETVRSIAWVFVTRPETVYVAGASPTPRATASSPPSPRASSTRSGARGSSRPSPRPCSMPSRAPTRATRCASGSSPPRCRTGPGAAPGRIVTLGDIAGLAMGDLEAGHAYAERVFAERRAETVAAAPDGDAEGRAQLVAVLLGADRERAQRLEVGLDPQPALVVAGAGGVDQLEDRLEAEVEARGRSRRRAPPRRPCSLGVAERLARSKASAAARRRRRARPCRRAGTGGSARARVGAEGHAAVAARSRAPALLRPAARSRR